MAGVGDKPPPPNFVRSINPNLIQIFFFHTVGYLEMMKKCEIVPILNLSVDCRGHLSKRFFYHFSKSNPIFYKYGTTEQ